MMKRENSIIAKRLLTGRKYAPYITAVTILICICSYLLKSTRSYETAALRRIPDLLTILTLLSLAGNAYLRLFTRNLNVNLAYARHDEAPFASNVKYAGFGLIFIGLALIISFLMLAVMFMNS